MAIFILVSLFLVLVGPTLAEHLATTLRLGTAKANVVAEETLALAKKAMRQDYFGRKLSIES